MKTPATVEANISDSRRMSMPSIENELTHFDSRAHLVLLPETSATTKKEPQSAQQYNKGLQLRLKQSSAINFSNQQLSAKTIDGEVRKINSKQRR